MDKLSALQTLQNYAEGITTLTGFSDPIDLRTQGGLSTSDETQARVILLGFLISGLLDVLVEDNTPESYTLPTLS